MLSFTLGGRVVRTTGRRLAFVRVSDYVLTLLLHGDVGHAISDAPADLRVVGVAWDFSTSCALLYCESSSFVELNEGQAIPEYSPNFYKPGEAHESS